jgi:transposase-like protein
MSPCTHCQATGSKKDGRNNAGQQRFRCRACRRTYTERSASPFAGYRWHGQYRLSVANVRDLLAERQIDVSARTILSWVHTFGPLFAQAVRRRARPLGRHWWCDETYVRVGGTWAYLYRAVDEAGRVVDVLLRAHRDLESARAFFRQAIERRGTVPEAIITDKHPAYPRAIREEAPEATHVASGLHRAVGPTTKAVERSHVPIKDRVRPMRGLQRIATGQRLLEGVEAAQAVRRGDLEPMGPGGDVAGARAPVARARAVAASFAWLATTLERAA